jgi:hypothetical protein
VQGFYDGFAPIPDVPIATVATLWNDPLTGIGYVLIMHEVLFFGHAMDHSLINPNQLRHHGVIVRDNPYNLDPTKPMGIEVADNDLIPFLSKGSMVFFTTKYPNDDDLNTYPHIVVTSDTPWDPHGLVMPGGLDVTDDTASDRLTQQVTSNAFRNNNRHHQMYESDRISFSVDGNTEQLIIECMISSVHISSVQHMEQLQSKTRHSQFGPEHVATIFGVGLGTAKEILTVTTQKGVRHAVTPLTRHYRVDHIHLHHTYLAGKWTLDHIESKYKSIRGHTGAIVISNGNFVAVYPTASKGDQDSTESLRRFTEDVGIPANLKVDMATAFVG